MAFFKDATSSEAHHSETSGSVPLPKLDLDLSSHFAAVPRPQRLLKIFLLGSFAAHLCIVGAILTYDLHWKPQLPQVEVPVEVMSEAEAQKQAGAGDKAGGPDKQGEGSGSKGDGAKGDKAGDGAKAEGTGSDGKGESAKAAADKAAEDKAVAEQKAAQDKAEQEKAEAAKQEQAKQEAAAEKANAEKQAAEQKAAVEKKPEEPKQEPAKQEQSKQEPPKQEPSKEEEPKVAEPKPAEKPSPKMEAKARAEAKAQAKAEAAAAKAQAKAEADAAKAQAKAEAEQAKAEAQQAKAQAALEKQEAKLAELQQQAATLRALQQQQQEQQTRSFQPVAATPQQEQAMNGALAVLNPKPAQGDAAAQGQGQDPINYKSQDHFDQAVATSLPTNDPNAEPVAFSQIVFGLLERAKQFPDSAKRRHAQGVASIAFSIDDTGQPQNIALLRSSGQADLDVESLSMILRAAPFPVPPEGAQRAFAIDVHFGGV